jgi:hypothetical protein
MGPKGNPSPGSELLLGMHGFVGGQSQNSGRAPGLQHAASVSRGWRRIEVKTTEAHSVRSPSGVRRSGAGVGGSLIDLGLGMIALVAITREMFRPGRGWKRRSGQASLRIAGVRWDAEGDRITPPCLVLSLLCSLDSFEVILGEGRITAGRGPKR